MKSLTNSRRVPLDKRKRTETSCDRCRVRKQKCDRLLNQDQCRYCEIHGVTCSTTAPRPKRVVTCDGMGSRIRLLESLVKGLLPEADVTSIDGMQQIGTSLGIPLPPLHDNDYVTDDTSIAREPSYRDDEEKPNAEVIPDNHNQIQYVGPSSSFLFHLKLRRMLGGYSIFKFALFGNNAADQIFEPAAKAVDSSSSAHAIRSADDANQGELITECSSPSDAVKEIDGQVIEVLMEAYFDVIHPDFPVVHEVSFHEVYEMWCSSDSPAEPEWLCSVLCMLILARRVAMVEVPEEAEKKWWRHVQTLLPTVIFSSNTSTVQALMLAALHLHNNNHRDACWNLTGTAVRVAHAIGMHRGADIRHIKSRVNREFRKQLWWTLYAFEQMQVSSYDRPSAIANVNSLVECPNERILGTVSPFSPDFVQWSRKLFVILGKACQALEIAGPCTRGASPPLETLYTRPLSPMATILRDLERWEMEIPLHLRLDGLNMLAPSSKRPLILLHVQYYYIKVLVTRSAPLRRATLMAQNDTPDPSKTATAALAAISETCIGASLSLARLLLRLDSINQFNAVTWFDVFYIVAAALVLVLDLYIRRSDPNSASASAPESKILLQDLSALTAKHMRNPRMPGTMRALAQIVVDVNSTAEQFTASKAPPMPETAAVQAQQRRSDQLHPPDTVSVPEYLQAGIGSREAPWSRDYSNDSDFLAQLSSLDHPVSSWQDWAWEDIETIVRGG